MHTLSHRVTVLLQHLLKTSTSLLRSRLFIEGSVSVDVQQLHLLVDMIQSLLQVALLAVGWKVQWLERRKRPHQFFVTQKMFVLSPNLPTNRLKLLPRKIHPVLLHKSYHLLQTHTPPTLSVNLRNDGVKLKSIQPHKLLTQLLNSPIILDLLLKNLSHLPLTIVPQQLVSRQQPTPHPRTLHLRQVLSSSIRQIECEPA